MVDNTKLLKYSASALALIIGLGLGTKKLIDIEKLERSERYAKALIKTKEIIAELRADKAAYANFNALFGAGIFDYNQLLKLTSKEIETIKFFCEAYVMTPEEFFAHAYRLGNIEFIDTGKLFAFERRNPDKADFYHTYNSIVSKLQKLPKPLKEKLNKLPAWEINSSKKASFIRIMNKAKDFNSLISPKDMLLQSKRKQQEEKMKIAMAMQNFVAKRISPVVRKQNLRPKLKV